MPRIPDVLQRAVAFLYPDVGSAESGFSTGGTGFFVEVSTSEGEHTFLVTNIHVAGTGCTIARIDSQDGKSTVLDLGNPVFHPYGDDVAVFPIAPDNVLEMTPLKWSAVAATSQRLQELNAGVGDEVFMLGRFVSLAGRQRNDPLARFGNIAMMPGEPVIDGRGLKVEAFLVEMRSLSGFSGSPVFIYMGPGTYRGDGRMMPFYKEQIGLIGIDTGHFKVYWGRGEDGEPTVKLNSGISIVAPVWKIAEAVSDALDGQEIVQGE